MDKTGINAYTSIELKRGKFSKLFECMFNIILAISKAIIYLMIPPIQLLMVIIFSSYNLALKAAHEALDQKWLPLVTYEHVYIYVRITY